jgi:hypothetical protein
VRNRESTRGGVRSHHIPLQTCRRRQWRSTVPLVHDASAQQRIKRAIPSVKKNFAVLKPDTASNIPVMLRSVFLVHRFVAGGFGLSMLLAPEAVNRSFDPDRVMPLEEKLALQSWSCFMIIVALVVHHAANFPLEAQLSVARSVLVGLVCISILYMHDLIQSDWTTRYQVGVAITGSLFFALTAAYSIALYKDSRKESQKSA